MGMRPMQERCWLRRGEQYLLIKSPPASGKSRALMFIALDKLTNQKLKQAIIVVPEKTIGASFHDEPLSRFGFWADWKVEPRWNLCDAPGADNGPNGYDPDNCNVELNLQTGLIELEIKGLAEPISRVANAKKDPTYLLTEVEIVAT